MANSHSAAASLQVLKLFSDLYLADDHGAAPSLQVLELFPDLYLAVEENEAELAHDFFSTVRGWVGELRQEIQNVRERNRENTGTIGNLMDASVRDMDIEEASRNHRPGLFVQNGTRAGQASGGTNGGRPQDHQADLIAVDPQTFELVRRLKDMKDGVTDLSDEGVMDLFLCLAKTPTQPPSQPDSRTPSAWSTSAQAGDPQDAGPVWSAPSGSMAGQKIEGVSSTGTVQSHPSGDGAADGGALHIAENGLQKLMSVDEDQRHRPPSINTEDDPEAQAMPPSRTAQPPGHSSPTRNGAQLATLSPSALAAKVRLDIQTALQLLHEVDGVLDQLVLFWTNTEVIFDVLLRKGALVEKFVAFSHKPRLLQRFHERMTDYKRFWEGIQVLCNQYICGQPNCRGQRLVDGVLSPPPGSFGASRQDTSAASSNEGQA